MYLVVAVLVVIIVVGVAGYMLLNNGENGGDTTPTPTPTPVAISDASSLQFSVDDTVTATGDVVAYEFSCKNLNTETEAIRVDMDLGADGKFSYIVDTGAQKSWITMDEGATWTESDFAADCTAYGVLFHDFVDKLVANGDGTADYSYTTDTSSVTIFCIAVNPTIADSVFGTS